MTSQPTTQPPAAARCATDGHSRSAPNEAPGSHKADQDRPDGGGGTPTRTSAAIGPSPKWCCRPRLPTPPPRSPSAGPPSWASLLTPTRLIAQANRRAVDICLPHHLHADAIVSAAEAGLHVLCEKPLCLTRTRRSEYRRQSSSTASL
jgi:hypothetical protein